MDTELSPVAIADDGELEDVRRLLGRLDVRVVDAGSGDDARVALRISSSRRAHVGPAATGPEARERCPFHIVILDEASPCPGPGLESARFDFVVKRPVHPAALRLLILHALYSGPEKRTHPRAAMDAQVELRAGARSHPATLTQLSERGCGLLCDLGLAVGDRATVVVPRALTAARALSLSGRIVASRALEEDGNPVHEMSIVFERASEQVCRQLRSLMGTHGVGAACLTPGPREPVAGPTGRTRSDASEPAACRRRSPRKRYTRPVLASAEGAVHTLIGRDLSTGGMRVSADARLRIGDEFKLVIYGRAGRAPVIVKAVVARDDGDGGCALIFRDVETTVAASLADIVTSLPQLGPADSGANVVLSEIVELPARSGR